MSVSLAMWSLRAIARRIESRLARSGTLGQSLIKAFFGSAGMKLAYTGLGFVNSVLLAKLLAPAGFGVYSYVMALVAFLGIPSQLGIPVLATREMAVTNARKDWAHMRGLIIRTHQGVALFAAIIVTGALVALMFFGNRIAPGKLHAMALGLLLVPIVSLGALRGGMLRGLRRVLQGQFPEQIVKPVVFLALILVLPFIISRPASPADAIGMQIVAGLCAFGVGLYLFFRNRPAEIQSVAPSFRTKAWLKSTVPLGLTAALTLINGQTDILVLGMFREDADVGIYRVAVQMATLVIFGLQVVNVIQGPHIAHMFALGDRQKLQTLITRSAQAVLALTLPIVLILVLFGGWIIRTAFGPEYASAYVPLVILCAGQLVNASMGSVGSLLNMTGHERDTMQSVFIGATVNVTLNFALTPTFGMIGAATATAITLVVWNLVMWHKVHLRTGIEASAFIRRRKNVTR